MIAALTIVATVIGGVLAIYGAMHIAVSAGDWWEDRGLDPWERHLRAHGRARSFLLSESGQHQKKDSNR